MELGWIIAEYKIKVYMENPINNVEIQNEQKEYII